MINVEELYKALTGYKPEDGTTNSIIPQNFNGFEIPEGATATYRPKGNPHDLLVRYGGNSIYVNAKGPLVTDVGRIAPGKVREMVRKAISPYAS